MRVARRQNLRVVDADGEIGDLILDMAEAMGDAGRDDDDISGDDGLLLPAGHGAQPARANQHGDRVAVGGQFHRIGRVATGDENPRTGQDIVHLGDVVMDDGAHRLALAALADTAQHADADVDIVTDINDPDLLIEGFAEIFEYRHDLRIRDVGGVVGNLGLDVRAEGKGNRREDCFESLAVHHFFSTCSVD